MQQDPRAWSSIWYHALSLKERLTSPTDSRPSLVANTVSGELRLKYLKETFPINADRLEQRLAYDGLSVAALISYLGEDDDSLRSRFSDTPSWLSALDSLYRPVSLSHKAASRELFNCRDSFGLLNAVQPIVSDGIKNLQERLCRIEPPPRSLVFEIQAIEDLLLPNLADRLLEIVEKVLVLELNAARLRQEVQGETARDRYEHFCKRLCELRESRRIMQRYPVLARQVSTCISNWVDASVELITRLCEDWKTIKSAFSLQDEHDSISRIDGDMGDRHRSGRSVSVLTFASGFKLVYKPRPMSVDQNFQRLLRWLNDNCELPDFHTLTVIDRGCYGWEEFAEYCPCSSEPELRRFYRRQGGYLALLYVLEATDIHYSNLLACGEYPIVFDLETLFHPNIGQLHTERDSNVSSRGMYDSVLNVGMLPQRIRFDNLMQGVDLSGLSPTKGQMTPYAVPQRQNDNTDEMRFVRHLVQMGEGQNLPSLKGREVDVGDYASEIILGFQGVYQTLQNNKDVLLSEGGPIDWFSTSIVRVVLRPTITYSRLIYDSLHPDVMRDALDRDFLFSSLWFHDVDHPYRRVFHAECEDLMIGDIPSFSTCPITHDIYASNGECISGFLPESGMDRVRRRVKSLGTNDMSKQVWFIEASLASKAKGKEHRRDGRAQADWPDSEASIRPLDLAISAGDRICDLAFRDMDEVGWVGLALSEENYWRPVPAGADLYNGIPGIALFLAYLGVISEEDSYADLARKAMRSLYRRYESQYSTMQIGAFDGLAGVLYVAMHLGEALQDPAHIRAAEVVLDSLQHSVDDDEYYDVIGGAAGCLMTLISYYRYTGSDKALALAVRCGDRLLAGALSLNDGIGWTTTHARSNALTGFSHGAAGISLALSELAIETGAQKYKSAALQAITYERSQYSPEEENWEDLRYAEAPNGDSDSEAKSFATAWCHGAPGIGLARLNSLDRCDDEFFSEEIEIAIANTMKFGFGDNHSLCHGDLGNLEFLLQASKIDKFRSASNYFKFSFDRICQDLELHGWRCAVPQNVATPGLMLGLAGIGYGLLRMAYSDRVPSVLTLDAPMGFERRA